MAPQTLTGPSAPPAGGGPARQLVVLLHGVGADGNDLIGLAPLFAGALPEAEFIAPNGPYPYDMAPFGYQWFSLTDRSPQALVAGVRAAAPLLDAFLDAALAERGLADRDLALVGFSQGTMMALHVAPRRLNACAAVVGYSGLLADAASLSAELRSRPSVLLVHGEDDEVVPAEMLPMSAEALRRHRLPVEAELRPGLGHGIDEVGVALGLRFLAAAFARR